MNYKVATWNVNSLRVRLAQVLEWLHLEQPDVLALQETKLVDADFPVQEIAAAGYHAAFAGQKTYNGVALLSRTPLSELAIELPHWEDPQRRVLAATVSGLDWRVINLYVPNGQAVGSAHYAYKLAWLEQLAVWVTTELARYPQVLLLGDFNIAPDDRDVHDPSAWAGQILCSEAERAAFRRLLALGLQDTFRLFPQPPQTFSWWDYRAAAFRRNRGLRIDHLLVNPALATRCTACRVDPTPRRWERPSDHAPVIAEFTVASSQSNL